MKKLRVMPGGTENIRKIKIIEVPCGQSPKWVRKEWIGVILPSKGQGHCMLNEKKIEGYLVGGKIAINILKVKSPEAFWWLRRNMPKAFLGNAYLVFEGKACKVVND